MRKLTRTQIRTAAEWHGGQWSSLYSIASTGKVWSEEHRVTAIGEVNCCLLEGLKGMKPGPYARETKRLESLREALRSMKVKP